jgi:hypothetical protein
MRRPVSETTRRLQDIDAELERLLQEKRSISLQSEEGIEARVSRLEREEAPVEVSIDLEMPAHTVPEVHEVPKKPKTLLFRLIWALWQLFYAMVGKRRKH